MSARRTLIVNGKTVIASEGDTLIDAALGGRIVIPHDCLSGQCESCRVQIVSGAVDGHGTEDRGSVLGCMATLAGDAEIAFDPVPIPRKRKAVVEQLIELGPDLFELRLRLNERLTWLPGQYVRLGFAGFPGRDFSPTQGHDLHAEEDLLVFHIRRYSEGRVSSEIGRRIGEGHAVTVRGPHGSAFLRRGEGRLVMASTGTGWAPIWAMAVAARLGQPHRPLTVIAGARFARDLYMGPALDWLAMQGAEVIRTASDGDGTAIRTERPAELLPVLGPADTVHVAGNPSTVAAVHAIADAAGAVCHADPFWPGPTRLSFGARLKALLALGRKGRALAETAAE